VSVPRFRVSAHGEWFYTDIIEAADLTEARKTMVESIRNRRLQPITGPGITFVEHHPIEEVPAEPDPR
jgi:hypothetical protein